MCFRYIKIVQNYYNYRTYARVTCIFLNTHPIFSTFSPPFYPTLYPSSLYSVFFLPLLFPHYIPLRTRISNTGLTQH